eukprot:756482-Hanusia_phi.AAC.3
MGGSETLGGEGMSGSNRIEGIKVGGGKVSAGYRAATASSTERSDAMSFLWAAGAHARGTRGEDIWSIEALPYPIERM